jgi:Zn-dependent metalloprotease
MKKLIFFLFLICPLIGNGQQKIVTKILDKHGIINHMVFDNTVSFIPIEKGNQLLKDSLKLLKEDELVLFKETKDNLGFTRQIFEQRYNGVKVEDGLYGIHSKNGEIEYISGEYKRVKNVVTVSSISETDALKKALVYINAKIYRWQIPWEESKIKIDKKDQTATFYPKGELVICQNVIKNDSIYRLAYKFDIFAVDPVSHAIYYVDAISGDILDVRNLIFDTNTSASGTSLYRGTVQFTADDNYQGGYRLYETRSSNNVVIHTYNANHVLWNHPPTGYTEFTNPTTTWPSDAAIDAHWGTEKVFDYWLSAPRNRNSLDNAGMAINGYVHWGSGSYADNAGWDGYEMIYGDGYTIFNYVVSLDVIAHEMGHGIQQYACQLSSSSGGETQAINEGLSDIWGAVIENWVDPNPVNNWLIGEQIMLNGRQCLRSLRSPKTEGYNPPIYPGGYPNTYQKTYWVNVSNCQIHNPDDNDHCACHTNSTILSHWFYRLSQGGSGTNDIPHTYTVYGVGIDKAAAVVWQAESVNLTTHHNAQYSDVMTQTIQAATDLYGANSLEVMQVQNAWYAVGLGSQPTQMTISGPTIVCYSPNSTFTLNNRPTGTTVNWTKSSNLYIVSGQNTDALTVHALSTTSSGEGWVQANLYTGTGNVVTVRYQNFWVGVPAEPTIDGEQYPGCGDINWYFLISDYYWGTYSWSVTNGLSIIGYSLGRKAKIRADEEGSSFIYCDETNTCGTNYGSLQVLVGSCFDFLLFPNPANDYVEITIDGTKMDISKLGEYDINIINVQNVAVSQLRTAQPSIRVSTKDLLPGIYVVQLIYKGKSYAKQLVISH